MERGLAQILWIGPGKLVRRRLASGAFFSENLIRIASNADWIKPFIRRQSQHDGQAVFIEVCHFAGTSCTTNKLWVLFNKPVPVT